MARLMLMLILTTLTTSLAAKEDNRLKEKLWKAVKEYVKETDTYKYFDYGKKSFKKIKRKFFKGDKRNK